jgi:hypothetical protein
MTWRLQKQGRMVKQLQQGRQIDGAPATASNCNRWQQRMGWRSSSMQQRQRRNSRCKNEEHVSAHMSQGDEAVGAAAAAAAEAEATTRREAE